MLRLRDVEDKTKEEIILLYNEGKIDTVVKDINVFMEAFNSYNNFTPLTVAYIKHMLGMVRSTGYAINFVEFRQYLDRFPLNYVIDLWKSNLCTTDCGANIKRHIRYRYENKLLSLDDIYLILKDSYSHDTRSMLTRCIVIIITNLLKMNEVDTAIKICDKWYHNSSDDYIIMHSVYDAVTFEVLNERYFDFVMSLTESTYNKVSILGYGVSSNTNLLKVYIPLFLKNSIGPEEILSQRRYKDWDEYEFILDIYDISGCDISKLVKMNVRSDAVKDFIHRYTIEQV